MMAVPQTMFVRSSQVTNHGSVRMSPKQNNSSPCGASETGVIQQKLLVKETLKADGHQFIGKTGYVVTVPLEHRRTVNSAWTAGRKKDFFSLDPEQFDNRSKQKFVPIGVKKYWKNTIAVPQKRFVRSSQVTNHGAMRMSPTQDKSPLCGSSKTSQIQRKFVQEALRSRLAPVSSAKLVMWRLFHNSFA